MGTDEQGVTVEALPDSASISRAGRPPSHDAGVASGPAASARRSLGAAVAGTAALAVLLGACSALPGTGTAPPTSPAALRTAASAPEPAGEGAAAPSPSNPAPPAPNGSFTLLDGERTTLSSYRGTPVLLWFIASGCASCEASIPAVAAHLDAFATAHTRILVLGLYGAFGEGASGRAELATFGRVAAGAAFSNPTWTWGLASARLTEAYDGEGVPDDYFLIDGAGYLVYHGSVPVSTLPALLHHLEELGGPVRSPAATTASTSPGSTLP
jgi:hypothetical protein